MAIDKKENFTNELFGKRFSNTFELVNYAIRLAKNMLSTGRACRIMTPIQNRAYEVLIEIKDNKDLFDEVIEPATSFPEESSPPVLEEMIKPQGDRKKKKVSSKG